MKKDNIKATYILTLNFTPMHCQNLKKSLNFQMGVKKSKNFRKFSNTKKMNYIKDNT